MIPSYGWQKDLKKSTEFLSVTHSLFQFHEMLKSKWMRFSSPVYSRFFQDIYVVNNSCDSIDVINFNIKGETR